MSNNKDEKIEDFVEGIRTVAKKLSELKVKKEWTKHLLFGVGLGVVFVTIGIVGAVKTIVFYPFRLLKKLIDNVKGGL